MGQLARRPLHRHRLLPVVQRAAAAATRSVVLLWHCTLHSVSSSLFHSVEQLALTGLVEVDDEEADEWDAAGAVVLAAARQEVRAAEVALPASGSSPSQLRSK